MAKRPIYVGFVKPVDSELEEQLNDEYGANSIYVTIIQCRGGGPIAAIAASNYEFKYRWDIVNEGEIYNEKRTRLNFEGYPIDLFLQELATLNEGVVLFGRLWRQGLEAYEQLNSLKSTVESFLQQSRKLE